jgi:predicted dehydrogenase
VLERVRQIIASGEIGKIIFAQMNSFEYLEMDATNRRHWFLEKEKSGGGPMMDFGCHRLEVLTDLFGNVRQLQSIVTNAAFEREVEDTAAVLLQFESGPTAALVVTHAASEPQDTLDIFGSTGSIHVPVLNEGDIRITSAKGQQSESHPPAANIHQPLIEDFADAIIQNREPRVTGETGRLVAVLEDEIYKAVV